LDKKISEEFWKEKHNEWQYEIAICMEKIKEHTQASIDYMTLGGNLLELIKNFYPRYIQQNMTEKKKLLKIIFSNFFVNGGNIDYTYKKPFDLIVEGASCSKWWAVLDSLESFAINGSSPCSNCYRNPTPASPSARSSLER
jgi:hypothetical protein